MDPRTSCLSRPRASTNPDLSAPGNGLIEVPSINIPSDEKARAIYYAEIEAAREYDDSEDEIDDDYNDQGEESEDYEESGDEMPEGDFQDQVPGDFQEKVQADFQGNGVMQIPVKKVNKRGPTDMKRFWAKHGPHNKVELLFNDLGQPCGLKTYRLTNFIGSLVKGKEVSLAAPNWREVRIAEKDKLWQTVQAFFIIDETHKRWVMKSASKKWRAFKATLKRKYFDSKLTVQQNIDKGCGDRIPKKQWSWMVKHWKSQKAKELAKKNKYARKNQENCSHTAGSRSFAVVQDQLELKEGRKVSRTELYCVVHTDKDGNPVDSYSAANIEKIQTEFNKNPTLRSEPPSDNDMYSRLFPKAKSARGHGLGLLVFGRSSEQLTEAVQALREAREENHQLRELLQNIVSKSMEMEQKVNFLMASQNSQFNQQEPSQKDAKSDVQRGSTQVDDQKDASMDAKMPKSEAQEYAVPKENTERKKKRFQMSIWRLRR